MSISCVSMPLVCFECLLFLSFLSPFLNASILVCISAITIIIIYFLRVRGSMAVNDVIAQHANVTGSMKLRNTKRPV